MNAPFSQPDRYQDVLGRILANSHDLIAVLDRDAEPVYVSASFRRLIGLGDEGPASNPFSALLSGDRERFAALFAKAQSGGRAVRGRFGLVLGDERLCSIDLVVSVEPAHDANSSWVVVVAQEATEAGQREAELLMTRERLEVAIESAKLAIFEWDIENDQIYLSSRWALLFEEPGQAKILNSEQFIAVIDVADRQRFREELLLCLKGDVNSRDTLHQVEFRTRVTGQAPKWLEVQGRVLERDASGRARRLCGTLSDVTDRHDGYRHIVRLNWLYNTLSQTNQAIARSTDEQSLYDEICQIAVDRGQFQLAWIGMVNEASREIELVAESGKMAIFSSMRRWSVDPMLPIGQGPAATALRENRPYICNDVHDDRRTLPWREALERVNYRATGSFPIRKQGRAIGILALYSSDEQFFTPDLVQLLEEMASDISFALARFEDKAQRLRAESERHKSEILKANILLAALDCIITTDEEGRIIDFNPAAEKTFGHRRDDVVGQDLGELIIPERDRHAHRMGMARYLATGEVRMSGKRIETMALRADGKEFPVEIAVTPIQTGDQTLFTAYLRDVTERQLAEVRLKESEAHFRQVVQGSPEAIFVHRLGTFLMVNPACVALLGAIDEAQLLGRPVIHHVHKEFHDIVRQRTQRVRQEGLTVPFLEERWLRIDGSEFDAEVAATPFLFQGERAIQVVVRDITERKQVERVLRSLAEGGAAESGQQFFSHLVRGLALALEVRYAFVAEATPSQHDQVETIAFWRDNDWSPGWTYQLANTPCEALYAGCGGFCYVADGVVDRFPGDRFLPTLSARSYLGLPLSDSSRKTIGHICVIHDKPLRNEHQAKSILSAFAVRAAAELERQHTERSIRHMAHHDALTGLPNRILLNERIAQAIATAQQSSRQVAVMCLDLDRFKKINDTLGHDAGDRGLHVMARRLAAITPESDIVARLGGDEFMVLVSDFVDLKVVADRARAILDTIASPLDVDGQRFQVTASLGIAAFPADGQSVQALLKSADIAMYRAKAAGKNNFQFYCDKMIVETLEQLELETELGRAINEDELVLHYQPKVSLIHQRVCGLEALVRWQHPRRGLLGPHEFITLAEETGLIVPLGQWVLRRACAQARAFHDAGLQCGSIAVNLSALQLLDPTLPRQIVALLDEYRLSPNDLELELTESAVMRNPGDAIAILTQLKAMGLGLSMDDFGTGYSSLSHLKRLPIDTVKIDRSFIQGVPDSQDDNAIARAIIAMAQSLSLKVIAEGVETEAQAQFLRGAGCHEYQGYLFSRPRPASEIAVMLGASGQAN